MFRPIRSHSLSTFNYEDTETKNEQIKLDHIIAKMQHFEQQAIILIIEQKATI